MKKAFSVCFIVILMLLSSIHGYAEKEIDLNLEDTDLAYSFFDLSNGEATLLQSGKGQNILIDTGSIDSQEELDERLKMYHVHLIDTIIITNQNEEYTGNLQWVISNYNVQKVIVPAIIKDQLISVHSLHDLEIIGWKKGDKLELIPFLKTDVIYVEEFDQLNKGALAIVFSYGKQTLLYMGIADKLVEKQLIESYPLKSNILKVADFGSEKGTSEPFLDEVDPQVAIVFRKIGLPVSEVVLERLQETWIDIYQTYRIGTVSIKCHDDDYEIFTVKLDEEAFSFSFANLFKK